MPREGGGDERTWIDGIDCGAENRAAVDSQLFERMDQ